jgi:preprotein translocase subunit SecA
MDYLREGIHLRGFAQIEPLVAYKNEAFTLFQDLMNTIWSDFARLIYNVEIEIEGEEPPLQQPSGGPATSVFEYSGGTMDDQPSAYGEAYEEDEPGPAPVKQRRVDEHEQLGRNDPCWCGSGKKFKKCHGAGAWPRPGSPPAAAFAARPGCRPTACRPAPPRGRTARAARSP